MLVLGDLILDHYIWGRVDRISPEAPVVVVQVTQEDKRPGGAGNVVNNLVALGAKVAVRGVVGDDESGRTLVKMLTDAGVNTSGVVVDRTRPTTIKTRVIAHAQQVVRVDREITEPISSPIVGEMMNGFDRAVSQAQGVLVSDYAKGVIVPSVMENLRGCIAALGKPIPFLVDPKAPNFSLYAGATVIKPNRGEAQAASGIAITNRERAIAAGKILVEKWNCKMVLITLGEDGMVLVAGDHGREQAYEIETRAQEVYDVSGAGDTVSAVFGLALASGADPKAAAQLANIAAGIVVAEVGTVAITRDQLHQVIG